MNKTTPTEIQIKTLLKLGGDYAGQTRAEVKEMIENLKQQKRKMKPKNTNPKYNCKNCGHTHIGLVGDLGRNNDETGQYRLSMCSDCYCENFKNGKIKV